MYDLLDQIQELELVAQGLTSSREIALVITKLQEARLWTMEAISKNPG